MTIELIDTEIEEVEDGGVGSNSGGGTGMAGGGTVLSSTSPGASTIPPAVTEVEKWSEYVEKYVSSVAPQVRIKPPSHWFIFELGKGMRLTSLASVTFSPEKQAILATTMGRNCE